MQQQPPLTEPQPQLLQQQPNERIILNWTDEETIKFIELYQRDASHQDLGRRRMNRNAYQRMSSEMEKCGYYRSADQLIRKMKRLRFDYKRARAKACGSKDFKYYEHMDFMLKQQSSSLLQPAALLPATASNILPQYTMEPRLLYREGTPGGGGMHHVSTGAEDTEGIGNNSRLASMEEVQEVYADHIQDTLQASPQRNPLQASLQGFVQVPLQNSLQSPLQCSPVPSSPTSSELLDDLPEDDDEQEAATGEGIERRDLRNERSFIRAPPTKRSRTTESSGSLTELFIRSMVRMQENTEAQYVRLLEKQMALEEQRRRDNQEFQLRLVSLLASHHHGSSLSLEHQNRAMAMQAVRSAGRLAANSSYFFCCDMQEKFRPTIKYYPEIITVASKLVKAANILDIPVIVTEQYPKALGNTVQEIDTSKARGVFAKTLFSMVVPEVVEVMKKEEARKSVVLFGIETQVCVQQTALDLVAKGYDVHVVADAVSSRTLVDRMFAFERMKQSGVFVTTSESVIFEFMGDSKHPKFKELQPLIKDSAPDSTLLNKL